MKKQILFTTALAAVLNFANANAVNLTVESGQNITNPKTGDFVDDNEYSYDAVTVNGGTLTINNFEIKTYSSDDNAVSISGGTVNVKNEGEIKAHNGGIRIFGGTLNLSGDESEIYSKKLNVSDSAVININHSAMGGEKETHISGGTINLENAFFGTAGTLNQDDEVLFEMTGGTINLKNSCLFSELEENHDSPSYDENNPLPNLASSANLTGGTINVKSGSQNAFIMKEPTIGGILNVEKATTLGVYEKSQVSDFNNPSYSQKSKINLLSGGQLNLSGTLVSDVENSGVIKSGYKSATINGNLTVEDGGEVDVSTNKLTVNGNMSFNDGSKFSLIATNKNQYGYIKADTITVDENNTTLNISFNGGVVAKDDSIEIQILNASTVDGSFANIAENERYKIEHLGNGTYKITGLLDTGDILNLDEEESGSDTMQNMISAAQAWDNLTTDSSMSDTVIAIANTLAELSNSTQAADKQAYKNALIALAPETAPIEQQTAFQTTNQIFGAVSSRLSGHSTSSVVSNISVPNYQQAYYTPSGYYYRSYNTAYNTGRYFATPSQNNINHIGALWMQGLYNKAKLSDTSKTKGFDSNSAGVAVGLEGYADKDLTLGIGYAYMRTSVDGFERDTDIDTHTAFIYGQYMPSNFYTDFIATYGWSSYNQKKNVAQTKVKANYDTQTLGLQLMFGEKFYIRDTTAGITPEGGVRYIHIKNKPYTDTASQKVKADDNNILTGVVGTSFNQEIAIDNYTHITPSVSARATYDFVNNDTKSTVSLINGSTYTVKGKALNRFGVELGAKLTASFNDTVDLSLGYEGQFRKDYQGHTALMSAKYKF